MRVHRRRGVVERGNIRLGESQLQLLGARTLPGAKGIATRSKGLTTRNKKLVETRS